jgi:hypothetical protein
VAKLRSLHVLALAIVTLVACRRTPPKTPVPAHPSPTVAPVAQAVTPPGAATPTALAAHVTATTLPVTSTPSGRDDVFSLDDGPRVLAGLRARLAVPLAGLATGTTVELTRIEPTGRRHEQVRVQTDRLELQTEEAGVTWVQDPAGCHVELGTVRAACDSDDAPPLALLTAAIVLARLDAWPDARIESLQVGRDGTVALRLAIPALRFRFLLTAAESARPVISTGSGGATGQLSAAGLVIQRNRGAGWTWQPGHVGTPMPRAVLRVGATSQDLDALGHATTALQTRRALVAAGPDEIVVERTADALLWRAWQIPVVSAADYAVMPEGSVVQQPIGALETTVTVPMAQLATALAAKVSIGCHVLQALGHTPGPGLILAVRKCPR